MSVPRNGLRILLVGDFADDPRLGSPKVLYKLQDEYRQLGHACDLLLAPEIGRRPLQRHLRDALAPLLAASAIARRTAAAGGYDVVDVAGAEGAAFGVLHRARRSGPPAFISRSNGLEHLYYQSLLDDHRHGLSRKPWFRRLWYPAVRLTQVAAAARLCDRLLLLNEGDRRFAMQRRWKAPEAVAVVPHGVSDRFVGHEPGPVDRRGRGLLFCGSWDRTKGIDYVVPAFTRLVREVPAARLTILGGGRSEEHIRSFFPSPVQPQVTVLARLPEEQVIDQYRAHDALVFCSSYEGFGMVLLEAMSQALPVIATPVGCASALVEDGVTGVLVPPRDARALTVAMRRLLEDPDLRRALAERARRAVDGMTWRATARRTIGVYESAARR